MSVMSFYSFNDFNKELNESKYLYFYYILQFFIMLIIRDS